MSQTELDSLVGKLPGLSWEKLVSLAFKHIFNKVGAEDVTLAVYENGVAIEIKTDEEGVEQCTEFWEKHVEDKI